MRLFFLYFHTHYNSTKYFESWTKFFHLERSSRKNNVWEKSRFMNVTHYTVKTQYTAVDIQGYITNLWKNSDTLIKMHTMLSLKTLILLVLIHEEVFRPLCLQNPSWSKQCSRQFFLSYYFKSLKQNETLSFIKLITNRWAWALVPTKLVEPGNALAWGGGIYGNPVSGPHQAPSHWTIQWNTYRPILT